MGSPGTTYFLPINELTFMYINGLLEVFNESTGAFIRTRGWLPYTLRWRFRVVEVEYPRGFALEASGDFVGRGVWTFEHDGARVNITYDWKIRAEKPLLRYLSFLLKPVFAANHRWAMRKGEESLRVELARRREEKSRTSPIAG